MNMAFRTVGLLIAITASAAFYVSADDSAQVSGRGARVRAGSDDAAPAPVKLLRISATVDGSGRIVFTKRKAVYEHLHWSPPTEVRFDGKPWSDLGTTPASWADDSSDLDLTKVWLVERKGRDVIALETTPDGFHLYLNDSPNSSAKYELTIAIPRRK